MANITEEPVYETDALKAIRIFWSPVTKKLEPWYLTSWVGYTDKDDDWSPPTNFDDPDVVRRFEAIVPKNFDRKTYGSMYEAPKEWIDKELKTYYDDNPDKRPTWKQCRKLNQKELEERQKRLNDPSLGPPDVLISEYQIQENYKLYKAWLAEQKDSGKAGPIPISQRKAKQVEEKKRRASESKTFSGWDKTSKPKSSAKKATLDTAIDGWLSFFGEGSGILNEYQEPAHTGYRTRPQSTSNSRRAPSTDPEDSEDDVPLARKATRTYRAPSNPVVPKVDGRRAPISSSSSDEDTPMPNLRARVGVPSILPAAKATISNDKRAASSAFPVSRPTATIEQKTASTNKTHVPLSSSAGAWDAVRERIPWAKDQNFTLRETTKSTPIRATPDDQLSMETDELFIGSPEQLEKPHDMEVDTTADAQNFMDDIYHQLAGTKPSLEDTSEWSPVSLMLKTEKGNDELCKVLLLDATSQPNPPSLKWIHRNNFVIKSTHLFAQLDLLFLAYQPWQHARLGPKSHLEAPALDAFAKYLSDTGVIVIADTDYSEIKLCIYPSWPPFCAERFKVTPSINLHLMVTVLKCKSELQLISSTSRLTAPQDTQKTYPPSIALTPSASRGMRILNFPDTLARTIQERRAQGILSYTLCTAESMSFRFDYKQNAEDIKDEHVDSVDPSQHRRRGVLHMDETVALIELMRQWDVKPKPAYVGTALMVFIHNNAWDMLRYFPGLTDRKTRASIGFYAYGPYHALHPSLWEVREIFKRGGVLTFTADMILAEPVLFLKTIECVKDSDLWLAFVSPLVVGLLQVEAAKDERALEPLIAVVEAIRDGHLSMTTAPPYPWKTDDWTAWIERSFLETIDGVASARSTEAIDSILDIAEAALEEFRTKLLDAKKMRQELEEKEAKLGGFSRSRPPVTLQTRELVKSIGEQVFKDLRQVMLVPVMHTEYRQFVVLHDLDREETEWKKANPQVQGSPPKRKDSIEHAVYSDLMRLDKVTFGRLAPLLPRKDSSSAAKSGAGSGMGKGGSAGGAMRSPHPTPRSSPITSR
ncbi:hypothetical protein PIIN_00680 [Serendipita indica DSM 11827]|uniref:Chromo domain-containing protein n=1 Tax=Serendipita indica (strain DSM 11827) TaxID=1109443 RepID=G4U2X0_SERID|nr:hypothetical protein PIIN_00680 [Serendipita indica DSM 11827]